MARLAGRCAGAENGGNGAIPPLGFLSLLPAPLPLGAALLSQAALLWPYKTFFDILGDFGRRTKLRP